MECVICCAAINDVASQCVVPCGHSFHVECLFPWILIHANCPLCRAICSKNDIVLPNGIDVKAIIYLDEPQVELGRQRAIIRYGYVETERSDFVKTIAYILLVVITLMLFMKAIGVKTF